MGVAFSFCEVDGLRGEGIYLEIMRLTPPDDRKGYLPAYHLAIRRQEDRRRVGAISLRVGYNRNIYYGGHIGYEVFEPYRGRRYAYKACGLLMPLARHHAMDRVIITCNPENIASRRTCELLGARLVEIVDLPADNEMYRKGERSKCIFELVL